MENFITSYGIPFPAFQDIINMTNSVIAGSSALALYLEQERIDPGYIPNDIDIWISANEGCECNSCRKGNKNPELNITHLVDFLAGFDFKECNTFEEKVADIGYDGYEGMSIIKTVTSLQNSKEQKIQVIQVESDNMLNYIKKEFDLSCCVTWWDSKENAFKTHAPLKTKVKKMYSMAGLTSSELTGKQIHRYEKYISRGFTFVEPQCSFITTPDPRVFSESPVWTKCSRKDSDKIKYIKVLDIISFEKTPIKEFLSKSEWNIAIKCGDIFYAFNRKILDKITESTQCELFVEKDGNKININTYKLPFGHRISLKCLQMMGKSDYSVYEPLLYISAKSYNADSVSLYNLKCYTIADWENGKPDLITSTPIPYKITKKVISVANNTVPSVHIAEMLPLGAPYNPDLGLD